jgi:hypothetical protein
VPAEPADDYEVMISASSDAAWDALGYTSTSPNAEQHLRQIIEWKQHTTTNLILPYLIAINTVERIACCYNLR